MKTSIGSLIKHWRQRRRMSQFDLASDAEVSTRHLSFVETGRSVPSQQMVLILARALEIPLRERNTLLQSAGYASVYRETLEEGPELAQVNRALHFLLQQAEPYGAAVVDRQYNVLRHNRPLATCIAMFLGPDRLTDDLNLLDLTFAPDGFRPYILNFEQLACALLDRIHRQAVVDADPRTDTLIKRLMEYPGIPEDWRTYNLDRPPQLLIPLQMEKDDLRLSLFTTLTVLGTAEDITTSEMAIEHYFPADDATDDLVRRIMGP